MTSIRRALGLRLAFGMLALLTVLGGALLFYSGLLLLQQLDAGLLTKARMMALETDQDRGDFQVDLDDQPMPEFERTRDPEYFQLWGEGERVLQRSRSLGGRDLPRPPLPTGREFMTYDLALGGRNHRAALLRFIGPAEHGRAAAPLWLVTTQDRRALDQTQRALLAAAALTGLLLLGGVLLLIAGVVRRGLRPLEELAEQASRIEATSLDHRFSITGAPVELAPIGQRLNDLLSRLGRSFERERRFTADVAHELRTPIAEVRSMAEVALKWPDEQRSLAALGGIVEVTVLMERLTNHLLALSRCDTGRQQVVMEDVDLAAVLTDAWRLFEDQAAARRLAVRFAVAPTLVSADRALLSALLSNLLSNAVEYTPDGGAIECTLLANGGPVTLDLVNASFDLTAADVANLFDPFWRKDQARSNRAHAGLGLTLAAAFAKLMGVSVKADLLEDRRLRMRLRFS